VSSGSERPSRPLDGIGGVLIVLLALNGVASLAFGVLQLGELQALERFRRGDPISAREIVDAMDRSDLISQLGSWLFVLTAIVWLVWQHRAHANLHAARVPGLEFSPGWAVGWWFIPVANLVKPFGTVRELVKASVADPAWRQARTWPVIGWWWACLIVGAVAGSAVGVVAAVRSDDPMSAGSLINLDRLGLVLTAPSVAAAILATLIVRSVAQRQSSLRPHHLTGTQLPPRPDVAEGEVSANP
jgi:hypothetical protein